MASNLIQEFYIGYFGRAGDPAGVNYWTQTAYTSVGISELFAAQPETLAQYPALNAPKTLQTSATAQSSFLTSIYGNLFGRAPDATGMTYWQGQLSSGAAPGLIIADIISGAQGTDITVMGIKATVAQNYTDAVDAPANNPALTWNAVTDTAQSSQILASITSASSTAAASQQAIRSAILFDQTGAPPAGGTTFTLTSGVDNFTGVAGNNTFNAAQIAPSGTLTPTWTAGDIITGGSGTNTFNVTQTAPVAGAPANSSVTNIQIANIVDGGAVTLDTTPWTGLTTLNVTDTGTTVLTASGTTAVNLNDSMLGNNPVTVNGGGTINTTLGGVTVTGPINIGSATTSGAINAIVNDVNTASAAGSTITLAGGTTVALTQNIAAGISSLNKPVTATGGAVIVNGGAATTSVTVTQTPPAVASSGTAPLVNGIADGTVNIGDRDWDTPNTTATIATVSLTNYNNSNIKSSALNILSLSGTAGSLDIFNGLTGNTATTLSLTVDGLTNAPGDMASDTITDDSNRYTTIGITTTAAASSISSLTDTALTTLNVSGSQSLTLGGLSDSLPQINDTQTAGATFTLTDGSAAGVTVDDSGAGNLAFTDTLNGGVDNITTGNGINSVTLGNGDNLVTLGNGTNIVGLGTGTNSITVNANSSSTIVPTAVITGLNATGHDTIAFAGDVPTSAQAPIAAATGTLAQEVSSILATLPQHAVAEFQLGTSTNTYIVEQANTVGTAFGLHDTLVELIGTTLANTPSVTQGTLSFNG